MGTDFVGYRNMYKLIKRVYHSRYNKVDSVKSFVLLFKCETLFLIVIKLRSLKSQVEEVLERK